MRTTDSTPAPLATAVAYGAALLLAGCGVLVAWLNVFPPGKPSGFVDIDWYRRALDAVAAGRLMYTEVTYPPITLLVFSPLRGLPALAGEQLWTGATIAVALLLAWATARFCLADADRSAALRDPRFLIQFGFAAVLLLVSYPVMFHLSVGQLSILVMALAFFDVSGLVKRRFQGSLVGAAAALKLTPLIFFPYYALTKQWRQLGIAVAGFVALAMIGFGLFPADSAYFWTHPDSSGQLNPGTYINVTLLGTMIRWLGDTPLVRVGWIVLAIGVGLTALLRARAHFHHQEHFQAAIVVGCASTLIGPIAWPHYQIWQVLAAIWLMLSGSRRRFALGVTLYAIFSYPFAVLIYGPYRDLLIAQLGREALMLASLIICLLGLPHSTPAPAKAPEAAATAG